MILLAIVFVVAFIVLPLGIIAFEVFEWSERRRVEKERLERWAVQKT